MKKKKDSMTTGTERGDGGIWTWDLSSYIA